MTDLHHIVTTKRKARTRQPDQSREHKMRMVQAQPMQTTEGTATV